MATKHPTHYIPGSVPRLGNWPPSLRMPPLRSVSTSSSTKKKFEKKEESKTESETVLWDLSDFVE